MGSGNVNSLVSVTLEAGSDLSSDIYKFVELASDEQVDVVSSAGGNAIGVLINEPEGAGHAATVVVAGIVRVQAGATVAAGDKVQANASGLAITATTGDHVLGRAINGGASGELISVLLGSHHILA